MVYLFNMRRIVVSLVILWSMLLLSMLVDTDLAHAQRAKGEGTHEKLRARLSALSAKRPAGVPPGSLVSIAHVLDVAERIEGKFPTQSVEWTGRAQRYLDLAEQGKDPYPLERGMIVSRGYSSPISRRVQGYTVYVPPDYTPEKAYPLMVVLHGGSSNGNLFLGVVLGNNMNWKEFDIHLWDNYQPRYSPDWIIAAPDGYGQVLWRWMGEQDVLDVMDDIAQHYSVDANRIVLGGLSNGGVGAYSIGSRHASRFAAVQAMAGAPSWLQYTGESNVTPIEAKVMRPHSALDLAENWFNTDFRYYHGDKDPGPMRPAYVHALDASVEARGIPHRGKWYDAGHDLLYIVHRHGKVYNDLSDVKRQIRPSEVHLVTGDYHASKQHWLEVTRFVSFPDLATLVAKVSGSRIDVRTDNVRAFAIDLRDVPITGADLELAVDGKVVHTGKVAELGHRVHLVKSGPWELGLPTTSGLEKRPGSSGPLTDAYFDRMIHVYGTQRPEQTEDLKKAAIKGSKGWPMWLWTVDQEVIPDTALTPEMARDAHLVLYSTPGANAVLERLKEKLPIKIEAEAVLLGSKRFSGAGLGTRFIYPNPESPDRYVIVQAAPTVDGVRRGHNLPDFLPDYVIYDGGSTGARPRLVPTKAPPARGFFDAHWQLPTDATR